MDSFELNKILGAILGTCLFLLALNIAAGAIFTPAKPAKPGYDIAVPDKPSTGEQKAPAEPEVPIEQLLAKADVGRGENSAKKCAACHTFNKGGRNLVGPNLWGIVGRPRASEAGFNYSAAMKSKDEIVKYLKDSFAYAHKAMLSLTAKNLAELVPSAFGSDKVPRVSMATVAVWHSFDHYGQTVVYARMNGIIPPASRK